MQIGMVGLGRMGANMVRRLLRGGHECVAYDVNSGAADAWSYSASASRKRSKSSSAVQLVDETRIAGGTSARTPWAASRRLRSSLRSAAGTGANIAAGRS